MKTYQIMTFGCQMNENDSEKLRGILESMNYHKAEEGSIPDVMIINTCSVRENADDRFFGNLGNIKAIKKENPNMVLAVCGCMMQQTEIVNTIKEKYRFVDIIFGTHNVHLFGQLLQHHLQTGEQVTDVWSDAEYIAEDVPVIREFDHKALVTIMNGCDNFCSYCIVPYTRGREKSRPKEFILEEIENLVADGCKEVMLLGQNVNSYGKGLEHPCTFAELLESVAKIDGLKRVRFMTSNPKDLTDELIRVMKENETVCNNIHLPLQSGSDKVLKDMNRHYTQEDYLMLVNKLRESIPDITISTDIIVGFPTETEDDFLQTLYVIEQAKFDSAFTFIYSPRSGTKAAEMEMIFEKEIVQDRFNRLLNLQTSVMEEAAKQYKGQIYEISVDGYSKNNPEMMSGRTQHNKLVHFKGNVPIGSYVTVRIIRGSTYYLEGEMID